MAQKAKTKNKTKQDIYSELDSTDLKIIALKQKFEKILNKDICKKLRLSRAALAVRLNKPELIKRIEEPFLEAEKDLKLGLSELTKPALDKLKENLQSDSDTTSQKAVETVLKYLIKDESIVEHKGVNVTFTYDG